MCLQQPSFFFFIFDFFNQKFSIFSLKRKKRKEIFFFFYCCCYSFFTFFILVFLQGNNKIKNAYIHFRFSSFHLFVYIFVVIGNVGGVQWMEWSVVVVGAVMAIVWKKVFNQKCIFYLCYKFVAVFFFFSFQLLNSRMKKVFETK